MKGTRSFILRVASRSVNLEDSHRKQIFSWETSAVSIAARVRPSPRIRTAQAPFRQRRIMTEQTVFSYHILHYIYTRILGQLNIITLFPK